jgi:hypothetical protein
MTWFNRYEVAEAAIRHAGHPVLGPATTTLVNLMNWTDANSDGWPYWQKPSRAARQLTRLIDGTERKEAGEYAGNVRLDKERADATDAKLRKAYAPIKAFLTRQGVPHDTIIVFHQQLRLTPATPAKETPTKETTAS